MAPSKKSSNKNKGEQQPSTPLRASSNLTHRRHHSLANDTINDYVGGMNVTPIATPSSAPRMGRSSGGGGGGRHNRHNTHSHMDLGSMTDEGLAEWSIGSKKSALAMAQYLDNVESSDEVDDICSFQDVHLDAAEKGTNNNTNTTPGRKQQKQQHLRHHSSDSFASNGSHDHHQGVVGASASSSSYRRARKMYYLMPMMWKHRYHIAACITTFLVCVIAISASVKSSMKNVNSEGNSNWKDYEPLVMDLPPSSSSSSKVNDDMEMVGPPLMIEEDTDGAAIVGPGGVIEEDDDKSPSSSSSSSRKPCMTSTECETRADLLLFPNYDEGPFAQKGCYYEGDFVYWGYGSTTTNDDEKDNDITLDELTSKLSDGKHRLWCDEDEELIAIDKVAAAMSIAEGKVDAVEGDIEGVEFEDILEGGGGGGDEDGVAILGQNFPVEEDDTDGNGDASANADGTVMVGPPLQTDSNFEENISAQWYSTDTELYASLIIEGMGPHENAMKFCEKKGKSLCTYNDYCPGGTSSRVFQGGPNGSWIENSAESEQWAPILAHSSESGAHKWVQIGKIVNGGDASENYGQCWMYDDWMNRDDANTDDVEDTIEESHRRFFLCCDD